MTLKRKFDDNLVEMNNVKKSISYASSSSSDDESEDEDDLDVIQIWEKHEKKEAAARERYEQRRLLEHPNPNPNADHEVIIPVREDYDSISDLEDWPSPPLPYLETLIHAQNQPFQPSFFQVERRPEDRLFLRKLDRYDEPPSVIHLTSAVQDELILCLLEHSQVGAILKVVHWLSHKVDHFEFDHSVIKGVASAALFLYPEHYLRNLANSRTPSIRSMEELCAKYELMEEQGCDLYQACESIVRDNEYSSVTEPQIADLVISYGKGQLSSSYDDYSYSKVDYPSNVKETPFFQEFKDVVSTMKFQPGLKVDDYTRMMINFARLNGVTYEESLLVRFAESVDSAAMYKLNPSKDMLHMPNYLNNRTHKGVDEGIVDLLTSLFYYFQQDLVKQLVKVVRPIDALNNHTLSISSYVYEVIEVSELRRRALACQFISRIHLIWAFYECGYGLPPKILETINLSKADKSHPPLDVYMTSIKFARLFDEKKMELEHFMFTVLYLEDFSDNEKQHCNMLGLKDRFDEFMIEVASDYKERPKHRTFSWDHSIFRSYGIERNIRIEELKKIIKLDEMADLVSRTSLILARDKPPSSSNCSTS